MTDKQEINNLLTNIQKGLDIYSVSELNAAIVEVLEKKDEKSIKKNKVIEAICDVFSCNRRVLLNSAFRGDNRLPASILIIYLNKEYDFSHRYISNNVFNQRESSFSNVSRIISSYKSLNPKVKSDADFIMYYTKVKNIVNGFA